MRFQIEERFFGLSPDVKEYEVVLKLEDPIARGEERIVASLPDEDGPRGSAEPFDEAAEKPYLEYLRNLPLEKAPPRILGWTSGPDDSPLVGAIVRAVGAGREYEMRSNTRGTFEFSGVVPGKYRVTASRGGFETLARFEEVEVVPAGCAVVSLPFEFEGSIRGTVKDRHGLAQKGLRVDLLQIHDDDESPYGSTETDSDDRYEFRHVDPARYRTGISLIRAAPMMPYSPFYSPGVESAPNARVIYISEAQPDAEADLWLPDPKVRKFEIEVFWPDGSPAKKALVELIYGRWHEPADLRADDHGRITVHGYELLDYRIFAHAKSMTGEEAVASTPVLVPQGHEDVRLRLVLAKRLEEGVPTADDAPRHP